MITDNVTQACARLREAPALRQELQQSLRELVASKLYREWADGAGQASPFEPDPATANLLARAGLCSGDGALTFRVNQHGGRLFFTDGVWCDPSRRVFPFCDESAELLGLAHRLGWVQQADRVIDLAGGCGHTPWSLDRPLQLLFDINPRAIAYAEFNKALNGLEPTRYVTRLNDINHGLPAEVTAGSPREILVFANMPFGPAPAGDWLPQTSHGGPTGMDLQRATFQALRSMLDRKPAGCRVRALIMGMSFGRPAQGWWMLNDEAHEVFGAAAVTWHLCHDPLLRINGRRVLHNPCPVGVALPALADCHLYHPDAGRRALARKGWEAMSLKCEAEGQTHLAYGAVAVELH